MGAKHPKNSGSTGEKYIQFFAYELYFFILLF